jgi:hypothetical protein
MDKKGLGSFFLYPGYSPEVFLWGEKPGGF